MKSKPQKLEPSISEFLSLVPKRADYEWTVDEDGLVHITVPKFQSKWGKHLCRVLRREKMFTADLDRIGSMVWKHCDGNHSVKDILDNLKKECGDENDLDQRLFLFLRQMNELNYISY